MLLVKIGMIQATQEQGNPLALYFRRLILKSRFLRQYLQNDRRIADLASQLPPFLGGALLYSLSQNMRLSL
jgi:hypothetical protein